MAQIPFYHFKRVSKLMSWLALQSALYMARTKGQLTIIVNKAKFLYFDGDFDKDTSWHNLLGKIPDLIGLS